MSWYKYLIFGCLIFCLLPNVLGYDVDDLVRCFEGDGDATDSTGKGNGSIHASTSYSNITFKTGTQSILFSGGYLNTTYGKGEYNPLDPFTLCFWAKNNSLPNWGNSWLFGANTGSGNCSFINLQMLGASGSSKFWGGSSCVENGGMRDDSPYMDWGVNWKHICYSFDGKKGENLAGTGLIFVDGVLLSSQSTFQTDIGSPTFGQLTFDMYVGTRNNNGNPDTATNSIYLDNIQFWDTNLTLTDVQEIYNSGMGMTCDQILGVEEITPNSAEIIVFNPSFAEVDSVKEYYPTYYAINYSNFTGHPITNVTLCEVDSNILTFNSTYNVYLSEKLHLTPDGAKTLNGNCTKKINATANETLIDTFSLDVNNTNVVLTAESFDLLGNPEDEFNISEYFDLLGLVQVDTITFDNFTCDFTMIDVSVMDFPPTTFNEYVYSGNSFNDNFTIYNLINVDSHTIKITGCYEGIPQNIDITICGNQYSANNIFPLCSSDFGEYFVDDANCTTYDSVEVNITSSAGVGNEINISEVEFNINFGTHIDNDSINVFYNSTINKYYIDHPHTKLVSGFVYPVFTCEYSFFGNNRFEDDNLEITLGNPAPQINFIGVNNTNGFTTNSNITLIEYSAGTWQLINTIEDNDISSVTYTLLNNTHVRNQLVSGVPVTYTFDGFSLADYDGNPYTLTINVSDTGGGTDYFEYSFNVTDTIFPFCTGLNDVNVENQSTYEFNIVCYDENFFSFNLSCDNGQSWLDTGLNVEQYSFTNTTTPLTSTLSCSYKMCDGHTRKELPDKSFLTKKADRVEYKNEKGSNKYTTTISYDTSKVKKVNTKRMKDRYEFEMELDNKRGNQYEFIVETTDDAVYLEDDEYSGWIVSLSSGVWIDFNNDDRDSMINVEKIDYDTFRVVVQSNKEKIKFHSIGEINCIEGSKEINVVIPSAGTGIRDFSFEEVLFLGFIIALLMFMLILGLWVKIAGLIILPSIAFMFMGIFVQFVGYPFWVNMVGIVMVFWGLMMAGVSFGISRL